MPHLGGQRLTPREGLPALLGSTEHPQAERAEGVRADARVVSGVDPDVVAVRVHVVERRARHAVTMRRGHVAQHEGRRPPRVLGLQPVAGIACRLRQGGEPLVIRSALAMGGCWMV